MSTRPKAGARRRGEILDAALACFLDKGFDATTLADIRERSGASTGSIYHLFPGKEAIAAELLLSTLRDWQDTLIARLGAARGAEALVRAAVETYVSWVARWPERARFALAAPRSRLEQAARDELAALNRQHLVALRSLLEPHLKSGAIRPLPTDVLVAVLIGPAMEWSRRWLSGGARTGPEQASGLLADAAWAAVKGAPPSAG